MSPGVLPQLVGAETTAAICNFVLQWYAQKSTTKVMHLHCRLWSIKKGSLSMRAYVTQIKEIYDLLAVSGSKISDIEQVATVLNGLSVEYESFVAVITGSRDPFTLEAVISFLIDAEMRVTDTHRLPIVINYVHHRDSSPRVESDSSTNSPSPMSQSAAPLPSSSQFRGCGRPRFQCQICGKLGYLADRCWHRFDQGFKGAGYRSSPPSQVHFSQLSISGSGSTDSITSKTCYNPFVPKSTGSPDDTLIFSNSSSVQINTLVGPSSGPDSKWYVDSGATHHVTHAQQQVQGARQFDGLCCYNPSNLV